MKNLGNSFFSAFEQLYRAPSSLKSRRSFRMGKRAPATAAQIGTISLLERKVLLSAMTVGQLIEGTLSHPGDVDTFQFSVSQPGWYYMDGLDTDGAAWEVQGPNGTPYGSVTGSSNGSGFTYFDSMFYAPIAGEYTLTVSGSGDSATYSFRLLDVSSASPITPGTAFSGTLDPAGMSHLFSFNATAGDEFFIQTSNSANPQNGSWNLINPLGQLINSSSLGSNASTDPLTLTGTYTLVVDGYEYDSEATQYTINVAPLGNTPLPPLTGSPLPLGSTVNGSLAELEEDDYLFDVTAPGWYYFDALSGDSNVQWQVGGPNGIPYYGPAGQYYYGSGFINSNGLFYAPVAGQYQLTLSESQNVPSDYSFRLLSYGAATTITPGVEVTGELNPASQSFIYQFTANQGDRFFLQAADLSVSSSAYWSLLDPLGNDVSSTFLTYDLTSDPVTLNGTYTLLIEGAFFEEETVPFAFTMYSYPPLPASPLTLETIVDGSISTPGEVDKYHFTVTQPGWFYMDGLDTDGAAWQVEGPNGIPYGSVIGYSSGSGGTNTDSYFYAPVAGEYVLTLSGYGDSTPEYSFRLLNVSSASPITPGTAFSGTLDPAGMSHLFSFNATAGDEFIIQTSNSANPQNGTWHLIDPLGQPIIYYSPLGNNASTDPLTLSGTYTLVVDGNEYDSEATQYTINVVSLGNTPLPPLTGNPLTLGSTVNGSLAELEQDDYLFDVTAPGWYYFDALSGDTNIQWQVTGPNGIPSYGPAGQFYYGAGAINSESLFYAPVAGQYQLALSESQSIPGDYSFRLLSYGAATTITPGVEVTSELNPASQAYLYQFSANQGDLLYLNASELTAGSNATWRLLDPLGGYITASNLTNDLSTSPLTLSGTYMLLVEGYLFDEDPIPFAFTLYNVEPNIQSTDITLSSLTVVENVPVGTTVGLLGSTITDLGDVSTFSLVSGTGSTDNSLFTIVGNQLRTNGSINYEANSSLSIRVRTYDQGSIPVEKVFTITVNNVNEVPTNLTLSAASIAENRPVGTTVGSFTTTDQDVGNTFTYTFATGTGSTDNSAFTIVGNQLRTNAIFNHEAKASYSIRVRTTDQSGLSISKAFTITISNVNELPTDVTLSSLSLAENQPTVSTVGTLTTTDPDVGNTHNYKLVTGTGSTDNAAFTISGNQLRTNGSFDFESKSSYTIRIRTTDQGGFFREKSFTISVIDLNEGPSNLVLSNSSVSENLPANTAVGTLTTTDPDAGNSHSYTLVSGTGSTNNAAFTLAGNQLRTNASFNFEAKSSYSIRIRSTDQGGLWFEKIFTISVTDVSELPPGVTALTNLRSGIAGTDNATGTGYTMYSQQNVRTRFSGLDSNNADNFINVRLNGTQWQYDNNSTWVNFTPTSTDVLVAELDFTADTVTMLEGNIGVVNGIVQGYLDGDLNIIANNWNGTTNAGEYRVTGTFITFAPRTSLTGLRNGVGGTDNATGTGYMMYSQQNVRTRFSGLDSNNADNFVNVRLNGSQWQYDNNSTWVNFTPTSTDVLVAELDFTADTVTMLEGNLGLVNGIVQGYLDGDLNIIANNWNGSPNTGEYHLTGTFITFAPRTSLTGLRNGVGGTDNATGTGYMMYSQSNVRTRFSGLDSNNADNFVNVRLNGAQWQYDNNSTWVNFVPTSSDRLVAALDFTADTVDLLKGTFSTIQGIASGYLDGDLTITPNNWNGTANTGEYHLTGTFITFMPTIA
ncbi:cadherin repeat domain-containing protein [Lacunimicrobium album]